MFYSLPYPSFHGRLHKFMKTTFLLAKLIGKYVIYSQNSFVAVQRAQPFYNAL